MWVSFALEKNGIPRYAHLPPFIAIYPGRRPTLPAINWGNSASTRALPHRSITPTPHFRFNCQRALFCSLLANRKPAPYAPRRGRKSKIPRGFLPPTDSEILAQRAHMSNPRGPIAGSWQQTQIGLGKRQRTGAPQDASRTSCASDVAPASWSAAALRRFSGAMLHAKFCVGNRGRSCYTGVGGQMK
jgi:hypothetical protein